MKFIVDGSVEEVSSHEDRISDLLSTITGGEAQIQDIQVTKHGTVPNLSTITLVCYCIFSQ